jgi:trehalose 6-phosphate synthase/phosphatase
MARLLIVSNRLPVTVRTDELGLSLERSAGGVATGLCGPHESGDGLWIGWPGDVASLDAARREELDRRLAGLRLVPVHLSREEVERYYEGFSNGILWPLFHYLSSQLPLAIENWDAYEAANERFAEVVAERHRPGDLVWVHDYQLMLVPELLRRRVPGARIGFFLHIPFPASEVFRTLPHRERLLRGLLGADLIGFHTASYMRHFESSLLRLLGVSTELNRVQVDGREVHLGVFPLGIDAQAFAAMAADASMDAEVRTLRGEANAKLLLGVDRLDYTKGIPRRLLAFERLLERHPELCGHLRLLQIAVPSREGVKAYQDFRDETDALIGRIHGAFATPHWVPIHYLHHGVSPRELVALYRAADVMLVTPLRDGMNLVAKEFVASRTDEDGVLVLSEFAGAASEMAEAIHVNPFDIDGTADAYHRALTMPPAQRRARMRSLRKRVAMNDVQRWTRRFLAALEEVPVQSASAAPSPPSAIASVVERLRKAQHALLLLDYDGTLVPFAPTPELAAPDPALLELLGALARRPGAEVHVISGRSRETLEAWLGEAPVGLHAEHGYWSRERGATEWIGHEQPGLEWRGAVLDIFEDFATRTPGSLIEEKTASLAWHYRSADPEFGEVQARELLVHLREILSNVPVEVVPGSKVIEARPHGVHKGCIVQRLLVSAQPGAAILALGDDRTDEDLFAALPEDAFAVHVGPGASRAPLRLAGVAEARRLLRSLVDAP